MFQFSSLILNKKSKIVSWPYMKSLFLDPRQLPVIAWILIFSELILNVLIIEKVPYTEIDWKAYMQECEGFINGTTDYSKLRGDTGPLVYPAGFVYIYSIFYFITFKGVNIKLAQYLFIFIYILNLYFVFKLYIKTRKVPPYVLILTILTSYRIHSINVLRLFNDPIAVLFLYVSLNYFINSSWYVGSIFYSIAVSIKMNILLYAPGLFFFYLINLGIINTLKQIGTCALVQLFLGLPFLLTSPLAYLKGSFDLGRVFNHTWTVNYRFVDKSIFVNSYFHLALLIMHGILFLIFLPMFIQYFKTYCRLRYVQKQVQPQIDLQNAQKISKANKKNKNKVDKNHGNTAESLTKEQENFLKSFESVLKKTNRKETTLNKENKLEADENKTYSINYDVLSQLFILPMFITNFIGIVCARSLHYQFYVWYFHTLPYLLWSTNYSIIVRLLILALIELCWNTYPSTNFSSILLNICHITILVGLYKKMSLELSVAAKIT